MHAAIEEVLPIEPASKRYSGFTPGAYYGWTASVPSQGIPSRVVHHPHEHLDFAVLWLTVLELLWLVAAMQRARQRNIFRLLMTKALTAISATQELRSLPYIIQASRAQHEH